MRPSTLLALTAALGCASGSAGAPATAAREPAAVHGDRNVITQSEIAASTATTAYDLVARLRPDFLRSRGVSSINNQKGAELVVYLDNNRVGGAEQLRQIQTSEVKEIRYYSGPDATMRFGTGHSGGAIVVIRR